LNAIQALSQLSYTPGISLTAGQRPTGTAKDIQGYDRSQEICSGKNANGQYLAALRQPGFFDYSAARLLSRSQVVETTLIRSHCWPEKGCIRIGFH
jgi:hypothetical protein